MSRALRGGAHAVLVDVFPQRDGRVVEGLSADDFDVFEDGKRQVIQSFEFVRIEGALIPQRDPDGLREMYALAADPRNRLIVIFLDDAHTTLGGSNGVVGPLVEFMNHAVGPGDLLGLATPRMLPQDITFARDRFRIEQDLRQRASWGQRQRNVSERPDPIEEAIRQCFHDRFAASSIEPWIVEEGGVQRYLDDLLVERRREEQVLMSLTRLVQYLGRLREARTTLLMLTDGWVLFEPNRRLVEELKRDTRFAGRGTGNAFGWRDIRRRLANPVLSTYQTCTDELIHLSEIDSPKRLRELISLANRGNITAYPVATTGLAAFDSTMGDRVVPGPGARGAAVLMRDASRLRNRVLSLRTLAEATDGFAVVQTNDLAAGLRHVGEDVSAYYLLGYFPVNQKMDGRFRRIEVKVRGPDLSVKARRGYVATRDEPAADDNRVVGSVEHVDRVTAALGMLPLAAGPPDVYAHARVHRGQVEIVVELASTFAARPRNEGAAVVQIDLLPRNGQSQTVLGTLAPGARSSTVRVPVQGQSGPWTAVVQVRLGGQLLRNRIDVAVEPGMLMGAAVMYRSPASGTAFTPAASVEFRSAERLRIVWPLVGDIDTFSARLLDRRGQPLPRRIDAREQRLDEERGLGFDLNLSGVAVGEYVLEMSAGRGELREVRAVAFRLVR